MIFSYDKLSSYVQDKFLCDYVCYAQMQGEMAIIGLEWFDFVVYSNGEVVKDRILADVEYWDTLSEKLEDL